MTSIPLPSATVWHDTAYDPKKTETYDLSVLLKRESYFYVITGIEKTRILALGRVTGIPQFDSNINNEHSVLEKPSGIFKRLFLHHYSSRFTLIPSHLQDVHWGNALHHAEETEEPAERMVSFQMPGDIICRMLVNRKLLTLFSSFAPEILPRHFVFSAISAAARLNREKGAGILLAIAGDQTLTLVLFSQNDLIMANAYKVRTTEDIAYYILNTYRHIAPDFPGLLTILSVDMMRENNAGMMVSPYIERLEAFPWGCTQQIPVEMTGEESVFVTSLCVL